MATQQRGTGVVRPLERGQRLTLTLGAMDALGECAALADGFPVHVFGGIPGEQVVAEVVRCFRERAEARVVEVLAPSPDRVAAPCQYFWPCTGCQWQHVRYDRQLALKQESLARALAAHELPASLPLWPTLPSPQSLGYRNHARFTIGPGGSVGYVNRATRTFVKVDECLLMHPAINGALGALQGNSAETSQMAVRYGAGTGEMLVQPRMRNPAVAIATGQAAYNEAVLGRRFRVASPSFFQVNTRQLERVVTLLAAHLGSERSGLLVDAYAGVGTFSVLLAEHVGRVIAIEESSSAVKDAQENAAGLGNVQFVQGKTEVVLAQLGERPDVLVLDPPRAGCHPDALAAVARLAPETVLYVSCEPETLGRDLKALLAGPFRLAALYPVDMFPQTHHVECLAVLKRAVEGTNGATKALTLASASPRRRELLQALGAPFAAAPSAVDEDGMDDEDGPEAYVGALALAKAMDVAVAQGGDGVVLGADTTVVVDGRRLGKPGSADEARAMLGALRGRRHEVLTGVALVDARSGRHRVHVERSQVWMREYTDAELEAYVATGGPLDKAGGYAVQDTVFHPAERVEGCYFNVMGLPVCRLGPLLGEFGVASAAGELLKGDGACRVCRLWAPGGTGELRT
jgi:23S rRNA (uracil1939-C5)-methyltransferase